MGPLVKLASVVSPGLGRIYEDSVSFGKQFPRHNDDGEGDAIRHAYASARTATEYSPEMAKVLGYLHELTSLGQDRRSQSMDEYNNRAGLGFSGMSDTDLKEALMGALNEGKLRTLPKGQTDPGYAEGGLTKVSHSDLYQQRSRGDQSVAPQEHRAFAREWTQENPILAVPSLLAAIPAYSAAKALGLVRSRTPASLEQMTEGYKGVGDGLSTLLDKLR